MTENEANMSIKHAVCVLEAIGNGLTLSNENDREDACVLAIKAIDELQQIKEIISSFPLDCGSTVEDIREIYRQLRGFLQIGTIDEFNAFKELNKDLSKTDNLRYIKDYNKAINQFAERMIYMMSGHKQDIEEVVKQLKEIKNNDLEEDIELEY